MFLHMSVILFTGGSASVHAGIPPEADTPQGVDPPGADTPPWEQTPPQEECMLGDMGNKQAVHILLECILVVK